MFQISTAIVGALAVVLPLGAMHLPSGRQLAVQADATVATATVVNRTAKSDRGSVRKMPAEGRTVSIRLESLPNASVVIQLPERRPLLVEERGAKLRKPHTGRAPAASESRRRTIACEPVVSVLTEVAKQLQPGRCIT
jgi:hypothetical protein